jgi:hypothetical protein
MKMDKKTKYKLWKEDPEYRKKVIRELEKSIGLNISHREFGQLVYEDKVSMF